LYVDKKGYAFPTQSVRWRGKDEILASLIAFFKLLIIFTAFSGIISNASTPEAKTLSKRILQNLWPSLGRRERSSNSMGKGEGRQKSCTALYLG